MSKFTNFEEVIEASNEAGNAADIAKWAIEAAEGRGEYTVSAALTDIDYLAEEGGMNGVERSEVIEEIEKALKSSARR